MAVTGVAFAVLLMTVQLGLLIGFATTASSLVDHAHADFWITPRGAKDVDQAGQMPERLKNVAQSIPGVGSVESLVVRFGDWKRPDGTIQSVIIVGVDPAKPALKPWNVIAGSFDDLRLSDGVIIDRLDAQKLGVARLGDTVEIMNRHARVIGFTSGIRTFTQSPYVFTSLESAKRFTGLEGKTTTYLLGHVEPGAKLGPVLLRLRSALPAVDTWTAGGFSWQTRIYWLMTTGAGAALLLAAILGVVVGIVIVSQTLYSATIERIEEYATMRAIGANNTFLTAIIMRQSVISGALGYALGTAGALAIAWMARDSTAAMAMSPPLLLSLAGVALLMCAGASLIPIRRVLHTDSASLFR